MAKAAPAVLALDVGTSSARALLFGSDAKPLPEAEIHIKYRRTIAADGTAEVDPDHLFDVVLKTVDGLLQQPGSRQQEIAAVGISTFWHGLVGCSRSGKPVTPLFLWSDTRSWRQAQELRQQFDSEAVRQRTGCAIHPSYWPSKLYWLKSTQPKLWDGTVWLSFADLVAWRLFGAPVTTISLASGTGLLGIATCEWDPALTQRLELAPEALPPVADGPLRLESMFAKRWPALATSAWIPSAGDGALASLGSGCVNTSVRALTVGTSGALRVMPPDLPQRLPAGLFCYRLDRKQVVAGAAFSNGGNLYEWMTRTLALDPARLEELLAAMEPVSTGLTFLPLLGGERSLGYALHARGSIAGLTLGTTAVEMARAALEGIAMEFGRANLRLDEAWPEAEMIVASGGGLLQSPAWMQMMADAIGKRLGAGRVAEASSRGAAILALESLGVWDPSHEHPDVTHVYEPDAAAHDAYLSAMDKQDRLYEVLVAGQLLEGPGQPAHYIPDGWVL